MEEDGKSRQKNIPKGVGVMLPQRTTGIDSMPKKRISISQNRQITIPIEFFNSLGIENEVDCFMQNNRIVIKPVQDSGEFDEQILSDLIEQGFSGNDLLAKFKEARRNVRPAVESLLEEAGRVANSEGEYFTLSDLAGEDI